MMKANVTMLSIMSFLLISCLAWGEDCSSADEVYRRANASSDLKTKVELLNKAVNLCPKKAKYQLALAEHYYSWGLYPKAIETYSIYLSLRPDDHDTRQVLSQLEKIQSHIENHQGLWTEEELTRFLDPDRFEKDYSTVQTRAILDKNSKLRGITRTPMIPIKINFEFGSAKLKQIPDPQLDMLARTLKHQNMSKYNLVIEGHTDNIGSYEYNLRLSRQRAETVKRYLEQHHGISPERLSIRYFSYLLPIASNDSEENRAKNRRVQFKVVE